MVPVPKPPRGRVGGFPQASLRLRVQHRLGQVVVVAILGCHDQVGGGVQVAGAEVLGLPRPHLSPSAPGAGGRGGSRRGIANARAAKSGLVTEGRRSTEFCVPRTLPAVEQDFWAPLMCLRDLTVAIRFRRCSGMAPLGLSASPPRIAPC